MIGSKFHLSDGIWFIRTPETIRIEVYAIPHDPMTGGAPIWSTEVTLEAFASVVSTMSVRGETFETWSAALEELKMPESILT